MAKIQINNLSVNATVMGELLVTTASVRKTKAGKLYVDATLTDGVSSINAKRWDCDAAPTPGVYTVAATVGEYNGAKQLTITSEFLLADADIAAFAPSRNYDINKAWEVLLESDKSLGDESTPLRQFIKELVIDRKEQWMQCTAAVGMHHVQTGGLVRHTPEVVLLATSMATAIIAYTHNNALIDIGLITAGAMLHDIGKLETYAANASTAQFERTVIGVLNEHITIGVAMLQSSEAAKKYPQVALLLEHIITSHHGHTEYGSPVEPCCCEAYIVHFADNLSATYDTLAKAYEDTAETATFTDKVFGYNRKFLTPTAIHKMLTAHIAE